MTTGLKTTGSSKIMSKIWFEQIFRFLHLADKEQINPGVEGHNKKVVQN